MRRTTPLPSILYRASCFILVALSAMAEEPVYCPSAMKYHRLKPTGIANSDVEAMAERVRLTGELLQAVARAIGTQDKKQRRFRYAVVGALSRLEAAVGAIHAYQLTKQKWEPGFMEKVQRDLKDFEELIARLEMEHGLKMLHYIEGLELKTTARRNRRQNWSGWEI